MKSIPKDRGPLGIALWLDFECEIISDVPSSSFRPQPDVASSIVTLRPVSRIELQNVSRKLVEGYLLGALEDEDERYVLHPTSSPKNTEDWKMVIC